MVEVMEKLPLGSAPLLALRRKYAALLKMRLRREALESQGILRFEGEALARRNAEGKALAREFPGVLRELDAATSQVLRYKLQQLEAALGARAQGEPEVLPEWVLVTWRFHQHWRQAMAIRGWVRRQREKSGLLPRFRRWYATYADATDPWEDVDEPWLAAYCAPPGGQMGQVVWQRLAREFDRSVPELVAMVFGSGG